MLVIIPAALARLYFTHALYNWERQRTQLSRRAHYIDWLLTSDTHAKELRLYQHGDYLRKLYANTIGLIRREKLNLTHRQTHVELAVALIGTVSCFCALTILAFEIVAGRNSVGDLALFFLIYQRIQGSGQEMVAQISRFYADHQYLEQLFEFIDVKSVVRSPMNPSPFPIKGDRIVRIEGVWFQYLATRGVILKNIELEIRPGQVVGLVGANGSGKTSLIKLLCRLYDPTKGKITLGGIDIKCLDLEEYRRLYAVVFQDFGRYADTVRQNIRFGDIRLPENTPLIEEAAKAVGADKLIQRLSSGYETQLTRLFDAGEEISVGEWQKIALARALVRSSQFVILDEPTSALDPYPYQARAGCATSAGSRRTRLAPPGMLPVLS